MTAGAGTASLLVLAWAHVTDLATFYAIWVGIGLTMAAVLYEPAFAVIATWFGDAAERTRALLVLTVIAGFASVIYVPLAGWLVQTLGWRHALIVLAVLLALLTVLPNATCPAGDPTTTLSIRRTTRTPWWLGPVDLPVLACGERWVMSGALPGRSSS